MKKIEQDETKTMVLDQTNSVPALTSSAKDRRSTTASDQEFQDLLSNYRTILRKRSIPYPIAYHFEKELGHGRQGIVFLVTRYGARGCLTHHAIKLFDPSIYSSASNYWTDMGRIAQQVSRIQQINTNNLVARDFYDECNGIGYMHMQAIDGIDLRSLLDGKQLKIAKSRSTNSEWNHFANVIFHIENGRISLQTGMALYIMRNVLRGIAVLHNNGFIHGDIKPTNIMIDIHGIVKLVDFGRAAKIGEQVSILLGSPVYMAPEIHRRDPGVVQSDIFSTGLVGIEMLNTKIMADINKLKGEKKLLGFKTTLVSNIEHYLPKSVVEKVHFVKVLKQFIEPDIANRFVSAKEAESGEQSLITSRQWLDNVERETEYERELENYLEKFVDLDTGTLNPHFASDNITAIIIT